MRAVRASAPPGEGEEGSVRGRDAEVRCASVCEASVRADEGTGDVVGRGAGAGEARRRAAVVRAADEVGAAGAGAARLKLNLLLGAAAAFAEANVSCAALSSCARRAQGVSAESEKGSRKLGDAHARTGAARRAAGPPLEQSALWRALEGWYRSRRCHWTPAVLGSARSSVLLVWKGWLGDERTSQASGPALDESQRRLVHR